MAQYTTGELAKLAGVTVRTVQFNQRVAYVCPEDHAVFRPPLRKALFAYHTPSTRKLTCPTCGYTGLCLEVYTPPSATVPSTP